MENLQNKNLNELFNIGIKLNITEQLDFIEKINQFSPKLAQELKGMFAVDPSKMGLNHSTIHNQQQDDISKGIKIPESIGRYKILSILGAGGMGIVYLGQREDINQFVAVKVSNSTTAQHGQDTRAHAITHEAKILASLQHTNIASLVDWGSFGKHGHYVAMEYVDGLTIYDYCEKQNLTISERIKLFIQVINATDYAHSNLIIHRDLKPANILVDESGTPILIDFGVARLMKSETGIHQQTQGAALTPSYASPEQLRGNALSIRSDIYSLGAVLFNLLTGKQINSNDSSKTPNSEKTLTTQFKKSSKWQAINKQKLKDIILVINKAIASDQNLRYHNAQAFGEDLQAILDIRPIKARAPSQWYKFKKFVARNRVATLVLSIALLSTIVATGFGFWQLHQTKLQRDKAVSTSDDMFNYSKFLETTLIGMNAYEGGSADITMEKFMLRAIDVFKKEKKVSLEQLSYHAHILSKIYNSWGNLEKSLEVLDIGLVYAKQSKSPAHIATMLGQQAVLYSNQAKYNKCINSLNEALLISKKHPKANTQKAANSVQLSLCYTSIGKYDESIKISKSIVTNKNSTKLNIAYAYYAIAETKGTMYQFEDSVKNYKKSEKLFIELYGKNSGMALATKAMRLYLEAQIDPQSFDINKQKAINQIAIKTLGISNPNIALYKQLVTNTYFLKNKLSKAIELQKQAITLLVANNYITQSVTSKIRLVDYYLLNNDAINAKKIFVTILEPSLKGLLNNVIYAMYYKNSARLAMIANDLPSAKKSLDKTKILLKDSINTDALIPLYFRTAQLAALEKDYQSCYDNAKKASEQAGNLYPKTWQLPNAYRYLQDVCHQKINGNDNKDFPYLQAVLDSPWKQETVITTKILNTK